MELDERAPLSEFDGSVTARDMGNQKLQHAADKLPKDNEVHATNETYPTHHNEKLKRNQSKENVFSENIRIYRTDQPEEKVFLPRLTKSSRRTSPDNRSQDGKGQQLRLPEIRIVPSNISMLALSKSITDLLDPEMEILNKIKHGPRKKRKKRRTKTVQHAENNGP